MASELSKFIDDELQKVDTAEERERLISKLRVRTSAKDAGSVFRGGAPSWQEQLLPRKRLLVIGLCTFFVIAVGTVAITKSGGSSKGKDLEMGSSSDYAFDQDQASSLIDNTYPMPGEGSTETMEGQGEIPPPGREQGVESNSPGSPATNIREDEGSSVTPSNSGGDALDDLPPIPASHHRSPPPPRKMGPSGPATTPATSSSTGHHPAASESDSETSEPSESALRSSETASEQEMDEYLDEPVKNVELAPSPELSEQQAYDKETEKYEEEVERMQEKAAEKAAEAAEAEREVEDMEDMGPTRDPVFGQSAEEETPAEREQEKELDVEEPHSHALHSADSEKAMEKVDEAEEAEEEAMLAQRNELEAERAEAEGMDRESASADEYEG